MDPLLAAIEHNSKFLLTLPDVFDNYDLPFGRVLTVTETAITIYTAENSIVGWVIPDTGEIVLLMDDPQAMYCAIESVITLLDPDAFKTEKVICLW